MTSFKLATHSITGRRMVEVWEDDEFIAAIYADEAEPRSIRVMSKHPMAVIQDKKKAVPNEISIVMGKD